MPTFAIDLRMLYASGIGTYLRNLVPLVVDAYPHFKFQILGKKQELIKQDWTQHKNIDIIDCRAPIYSFSEQIELLRKIPRDTVLFWSPHYNIPLFYRGKLLVTVHDVFHLAMPQYVSGFHRRFYAMGMFRALNHRADGILCVSDFTAREFTRFIGAGSKRVCIVHNGVDESWFKVKKESRPYIRPFLLYVGNIKPHKNLVKLIQAFARIKDNLIEDLVIVGKKDGFITQDKQVALHAARLGERVHFTGYVDDDLLKQYFVHAEGLLFPSIYEGFGLPPLEAMACGCPVIVSDTASLPEVCGDAALYFNPFSLDDIAAKILLFLKDARLREELCRKGRDRARQFTWNKCAQETISYVEQVLRT